MVGGRHQGHFLDYLYAQYIFGRGGKTRKATTTPFESPNDGSGEEGGIKTPKCGDDLSDFG